MKVVRERKRAMMRWLAEIGSDERPAMTWLSDERLLGGASSISNPVNCRAEMMICMRGWRITPKTRPSGVAVLHLDRAGATTAWEDRPHRQDN